MLAGLPDDGTAYQQVISPHKDSDTFPRYCASTRGFTTFHFPRDILSDANSLSCAYHYSCSTCRMLLLVCCRTPSYHWFVARPCAPAPCQRLRVPLRSLVVHFCFCIKCIVWWPSPCKSTRKSALVHSSIVLGARSYSDHLVPSSQRPHCGVFNPLVCVPCSPAGQIFLMHSMVFFLRLSSMWDLSHLVRVP